MMRFNQPLQGRGPRLPRAGRSPSAVIGCVLAVGVSYSQLLYAPGAHPDQRGPTEIEMPRDRIAVIHEAPIRVLKVRGESGKEAEARMLWAVRYLMGIAKGGAHE